LNCYDVTLQNAKIPPARKIRIGRHRDAQSRAGVSPASLQRSNGQRTDRSSASRQSHFTHSLRLTLRFRTHIKVPSLLGPYGFTDKLGGSPSLPSKALTAEGGPIKALHVTPCYVTGNVTGMTLKTPNVHAGCYGVTAPAPQEGVCAILPLRSFAPRQYQYQRI